MTPTDRTVRMMPTRRAVPLTPRSRRLWVAWGCGLLLAAPLRAEITALSARASAELVEFVGGVAGDPNAASSQHPSDPLPLQVVAQRLADTEDAAGSVAGQFSDPTTSGSTDPQEFAASVAFSSTSAEVRYAGATKLEEIRSIVFSPAEVNGRANGAQVNLVGTLFFDAVLGLLTDTKGQSLTDVDVTLHVNVVRRPAGASSGDPNADVVFDGSLSYRGASNGTATVSTSGDFPSSVVFAADFGALLPEFGNVNVLVLPKTQVNYTYTAIVGEPFELVATVELTGANQPGGTAAVGLLGTPLTSLIDVITATRGAATAQQLQAKLLQERAQPTGQAVLSDCGCSGTQGLGACTLTSLTGVLGLAAASGLTRGRRRRSR
jgi:hypothetical protein